MRLMYIRVLCAQEGTIALFIINHTMKKFWDKFRMFVQTQMIDDATWD